MSDVTGPTAADATTQFPRVDALAPPAPPAPDAAAEQLAAAPATETVTCPECGTVAVATLNRRDAVDFCRTCDFPLFWTPSAVLRDPSDDSAADSLRRLPGTVGRATLAALPCPHCAEPNQLSAQTCVRCGRPLHVVEAPPPAPVYVAPPLPEPVYVPPEEPRTPWWVWLLAGLAAVAAIVVIVLATTHNL